MNNGEIIVGIPVNRIIEKATQQHEAIREANIKAMPGPIEDAFSPVPEIKVGKYTIRVFCDGDFEMLEKMNHPIFKTTFGVGKFGESLEDFRGINSWRLFYLLTRPFDEAETQFKQGLEAYDNCARKEFSGYRFKALAELMKAVYRQHDIYWGPVLTYDNPKDESESPQPTASKKN